MEFYSNLKDYPKKALSNGFERAFLVFLALHLKSNRHF